jgi:hypothetical protein
MVLAERALQVILDRLSLQQVHAGTYRVIVRIRA